MNLIKSVINKIFNIGLSPLFSKLMSQGNDKYNTQITQKQLFLYYQSLKNQARLLPRFEDTGFRVFPKMKKMVCCFTFFRS